MAWAGSNPYAALSIPTTQREEPKPKKNLANAKDATKVHKEAPKSEPKPVDPKTGTGNNSAKPNRPERPTDRKGRQFPKHSGTGRGKEEKRGGKEWGEGKMGKRIEDGETEAEQTPKVEGEIAAEPHIRTDGERKERTEGRGDRKGGRGRGRDREIVELTAEEQAILQAEKEAEERQMTLEEWNAKKGTVVVEEIVPMKEARKVEDIQKLQPVKKELAVDAEWAVASKKSSGKKGNQNKKKEVLPIGAAPRKKRDDGRENKGGKGGRDGNNSNRPKELNLDDNSLFPSLAKK